VCLSLWPIPKCRLRFPAHPQTHPCTLACVHTYTYLLSALVCRSSIGERELVISLCARNISLYAREEPTTSIHLFFPTKLFTNNCTLSLAVFKSCGKRHFQKMQVVTLKTMSFSFVCSCVAITCLEPSRQPINAHICRCRPDDQGTRL